MDKTMTQHTPGPWRFYTEPQPNGCPIVGAKGLMVCMLAHTVIQPEQRDEALANAALIAAAPDMANALRSLLRHTERMQEVMDEECGIRFRDDGPMSMARDALRLAVGAA